MGCETRKQKRTVRNESNTKTMTFFPKWNINIKLLSQLDYARGNKSIKLFNDLWKPIKIYIYARKKRPFTSYQTAKHPKHSKFVITSMRGIPVDFFPCMTRVMTLAPAIILQKFFFVQAIIPCSLLWESVWAKLFFVQIAEWTKTT